MTQATMTLVAEVACSVNTCFPGARSFESVPVALRVTHSSFALSYVISSFDATPGLKQNIKSTLEILTRLKCEEKVAGGELC